MRILWAVLLPILVFGQSYSLKDFINHTNRSNGLIKAKQISIKAKESEVQSAISYFWPTIDVGGSYMFATPNSLASPGKTASAFVKISIGLYAGGAKYAILASKRYEKKASIFEAIAFKKSMSLDVVRQFFTIKKLRAMLNALQERSSELDAQIKRLKKFEVAGLATQEDIDKLQAVYDNNQYTIANTSLAFESSKERLKLLSGIHRIHLKRSYFKEPQRLRFEVLEDIKAMEAKAMAIGENAKVIHTRYSPRVILSNTYTKSDYDDVPSSPMNLLLDHQNRLVISATMRIFDKGKIAHDTEAVRYQKMVLLSQVDYAIKEQKMNFRVAKKSLSTSKKKLRSARSALKSARGSYKVVKEKYEAGLEDNIAYLDALTEKTLAMAQYRETIYDYEIGKSIYYYYAGKNLKEFIR
ncbi:MAG: TolC family protein [Sulfurovum sp.]